MLTEYYLSTDQPETCRECGTRTNFIDLTPILQSHQCPNCKYSYVLGIVQLFCEKCQSTDVFEEVLCDKKIIECGACETISRQEFC